MSQRIHRERVYDCRIFAVEECTWSAPDSSEVHRSVVRHPGAILVIPVLDQGTVVMIRNWRVAVEDALWEFPAGTLEPGEPPLETARRELAEETGYTAESIQPLGTFYTSPGFADELMHVFLATGLAPGTQALEAHEEIEVQRVPLTDVERMLDDGTLVDGKSIAALLLWQRFQARAGERED